VYLLLKSLHILAVVIFLGNITTGVFWKAHADRTGDPGFIALTMDGIIRSDRYFTLPGVLLIITFGVWNAINAGLPIWGTPWIRWSVVLFSISGIAFMRIGPLQRQMFDVAAAATGQSWEKGRYDQLSKAWAFWGLVGLLTPLAALFLMVLKPTF
jgi:uncharacterized membrane protein